MLLKIAWRNIWRNRRRTLITATSIFFAVFFAIFMNSFQRGVWDNVINNVIRFYFGFVQVHQKGYWEEQSLDKTFVLTDELVNSMGSPKQVQLVVPRLESFALASHGTLTRGTLVVGIDPEKEDKLTTLASRVSQGEYLQAEDKAVLVGEGLAERLKIGLGDTLVLISQGYHGINAAGKYHIKGLLNFGSPELSNQMVYLPLKECQWFFGAENMATSLVAHVDDKFAAAKAIRQLNTELDTAAYEIIAWQQMIPEILEMKEMKDSSSKIMLWVLYLIVTFGIFGTVLMMTKERQYEFGILTSIGMNRSKLAFSVWIETVFLGLLGVLLGLLVSVPLTMYFYYNPIIVTGELAEIYEKFGIEPSLSTSIDPDLYYTQAIVVFVITSVLAIYPALKILRLKPVDAMRS
ncbi:MAG: ABC transporter permease [Aureispira sp.]|nr:ABC transporter permease [Aureispira sp.]